MTSGNAGKVINLGGKGSSLSSSTVFQVSTSLSRLLVDSSTKTSSSSKTPLPKQPLNPNSQFSLPDYLTPLEIRASLLVFLKKLTSISVPNSSVAVDKLLGVLNSPGFSSISDEDCELLNPFSGFCSVDACVLYGVCALLDHRWAALLGVVDTIAALSIEALGGDIVSSNISSLIDSGDGLSDKDEVGVASDLKVFLNGSKLVGKSQVKGYSVQDLDDIPETHGLFRLISRTLHAKSRVFLNSVTAGSGIVVLLASFADGILKLGESSWCRGSLIVGSLGNNEAPSFISRFAEMFKSECPGIDRLKEVYNSALAAKNGGDNLKFVHDIFILSDLVGTILSWEAIAAFISLTLISGADIFNAKSNGAAVEAMNNAGADNSKANEKKQHKEKKKNKVSMGKGTTAFMQYLQDRLQPMASGEIEIWVQQFLSILDPKDPGYVSLLEKVKDIVDSNDSRRLPKLPKLPNAKSASAALNDFTKTAEETACLQFPDTIAKQIKATHGTLSLHRKRYREISPSLATVDAIQRYIFDNGYTLHQTGVLSLDIDNSKDIIATGGADTNAVVFDLVSRKTVSTLSGHSEKVTSVKFVNEGELVITGSGDNTVRVWQRSEKGSYKCKDILDHHTAEVRAVTIHPSQKYFVTASLDCTWQFYDLSSESRVARVACGMGSERFSTAVFHPDGHIFGTCTSGLVRFWDVSTQDDILKIDAHTGPVTSIAFSENGYTLATAARDGVKLWDLRFLRTVKTFPSDDICSVDIDYSGKYLATGGACISIYDIAGLPDPITTFPVMSGIGDVSSVKFGKNAKCVAAAGTLGSELLLFGLPKEDS